MHRQQWATVALAGGLILGASYLVYHSIEPNSQPLPTDYVTRGDNFDSTTLQKIRGAFSEYHVGGSPLDHEVYMITGGLHIANPRIMSWDSLGNMSFGGNQGDSWIYDFEETAQSPANWYMQQQNHGVGWTTGPAGGYKPVPWVLKHTPSGLPYYEWDIPKITTRQFYFKQGNTYIILRADYVLGERPPSFPDGLPKHLVAIGNPVTQSTTQK